MPESLNFANITNILLQEYADGLPQFNFVKVPQLKQRLEEDPTSKSESLQDLFMRDFMLNTILGERHGYLCVIVAFLVALWEPKS